MAYEFGSLPLNFHTMFGVSKVLHILQYDYLRRFGSRIFDYWFPVRQNFGETGMNVDI